MIVFWLWLASALWCALLLVLDVRWLKAHRHWSLEDLMWESSEEARGMERHGRA